MIFVKYAYCIVFIVLCHLLWLCSVRLITNLELGVVCIYGLFTLSSNIGTEDNLRKAVCLGAVLTVIYVTVIYVTRSHYAVVLNIIVPCLRQLVTGLPLQKSHFTPRPVCVGFVVNKLAVFQFFIQYFCLSFIFTLMFHNNYLPRIIEKL